MTCSCTQSLPDLLPQRMCSNTIHTGALALGFQTQGKEKPIHQLLWAPSCCTLLFKLIKASIPEGKLLCPGNHDPDSGCKLSPGAPGHLTDEPGAEKPLLTSLSDSRHLQRAHTFFMKASLAVLIQQVCAHSQREITWRCTKELAYAKPERHAWKETQ